MIPGQTIEQLNSMGPVKQSGTLTGTTQTVEMTGHSCPCSITLMSADATRAIQLSTNGDVANAYFTPVYDATITNALVVSVMSKITHVKFTGVANDTWGIA